MKKYDLIIIGGGPAGYLAAERASAGGMSTALFEKRSLGGVCLNEGCIPTKSLLYSAKILDSAAHGAAFGVHIENPSLDHNAVISRKDKVVKALVSGVGAKMKTGGVDVFTAEAVIQQKTPDGFIVEADGQSFTASKLLIATGSEALIPPIPGAAEGLKSGFVMTSREILDARELPKHLLIVGGGVIGLEMAGYFAAADVKVSVVEMLDKIAGPFDAEISAILQKNLQKKGVEFRLGSKVTEISPKGIRLETGDASELITADRVLLSIGRKPAISGIGLENIGVYIERGAVVTDRQMRVGVPDVYAAGDVNGKSMLAHTAYREAEVAVNNMLGRKDSMRYNAIPSVIYTQPEAASVGETEESAAAKGLAVKSTKISMRYAGRYVAENEGGDGICKLLLDKGSGRVLGVHMIGGYASEIITSAVFIVESGWPLETLKEMVFPHPTVGEIIREALFEIK
ncbi:MAG: dihydrolipoyl dehydrogenase [Clostridiales Family XIII bacterium]|jgi:dihydrolipoamide dehydrogenase|nr:dihydrolipoyl dehydrogenase [Clostridiales Family XIII bacterium]